MKAFIVIVIMIGSILWGLLVGTALDRLPCSLFVSATLDQPSCWEMLPLKGVDRETFIQIGLVVWVMFTICWAMFLTKWMAFLQKVLPEGRAKMFINAMTFLWLLLTVMLIIALAS